MTSNPPRGEDAFDAFISYSRKDKAFALSLATALNNFRPPKLPGVPERRLRVFRDESDLVGSDYYESIGDNLRRARKFILVCSPHSAQSEFVNDEIKRFLELGEANAIVPIIIDGKPNNEATPAEASQRAFPPALCEALELPLAISYLGFDPRREKVHKGAREGSWYSVVASILDVSRNELEERERKRQQRRRAVALSITSAVIAALSALTVIAFWQRSIAVERQISAESRLLAIQAAEALNKDESLLVRSMLVALESLRKKPSASAASTLRIGLARLGTSQASIDYESNQTGTAESADGRYEMRYEVTEGEGSARNAFPYAHGTRWEARVLSSGEEIALLRPTQSLGRPGRCQNAPPGLDLTFGGAIDAASGFRFVRVTNKETGAQTFLVHDGAVTACAVSGSGELIVTASGDIERELPPEPIPGDYTLRIWKLPSPVLALSEENLRQELVATAFSPSGGLLATAALRERRVRLFDLEAGTERARLPVENQDVADLDFSADGRLLAAAPIYGDFFEVWSVDDLQKVASLRQYSSVGSVELSPDGRYLITDYDEMNRGPDVWDLQTKQRLDRFRPEPAVPYEMSFSPDGRYALALEQQRLDGPPWRHRRLVIRDVASGEVISTTEGLASYALSRSGRVLVLQMAPRVDDDGEQSPPIPEDGRGDLQIWSMDPPTREKVLATATAGCLALSPTGRYLAFCREGPTLVVLDLSNGKELHEFGGDDAIGSPVFSPDERFMATASHARGGREVSAFRVANVVAVREVRSGKTITTLQHQGNIDDLAFSPDGKYIGANVYLSEESGFAPAYVWMWRYEDLIEAACSALPRNMTLDEWTSYMPSGESYRKTCENLPEHRSAL